MYLPEEKAYGLGVAAYAMAHSYTTQQPLVRVGARHARKLTAQVRGSAHISRLTGDHVLYILEERAAQAASLVTDVGVRLPAITTASGLAMLAYLSPKQQVAAVGEAARADAFLDTCGRIRARGWSEEVGQVTAGQRTVAAVIFDHLGHPASALAVTFPVGSLNDRERDELALDVMQRAGAISGTVYGAQAGQHLRNLVSQTAERR